MTGGRRVATNVLFNVASQVWLTLLVIVTVPIVLHRVGPAAYGVFVLASLLLGYTALLDLGLTPAVVRSIAVHNARGDRVRLERVLGTALSLLIGLAIVGGGLIALVTPVAVRSVLHVPDALQADALHFSTDVHTSTSNSWPAKSCSARCFCPISGSGDRRDGAIRPTSCIRMACSSTARRP